MRLVPALAASVILSATAAQADVLRWSATFEPEGGGGRTGSGSALISFDTDSHLLSYAGSFSGLSGLTTASHFHCCTAAPLAGTIGIAVDSPSLAGFPLGVSSGTFDSSLDLDEAASFNAAFMTANGGTTDLAIAAFLTGIDQGKAYHNIHSSTFPGGEIRGFLQPVPEPSTYALLALGLAAVGATARRRHG
jgi:CHRD domain/PEP-CTERM motif